MKLILPGSTCISFCKRLRVQGCGGRWEALPNQDCCRVSSPPGDLWSLFRWLPSPLPPTHMAVWKKACSCPQCDGLICHRPEPQWSLRVPWLPGQPACCFPLSWATQSIGEWLGFLSISEGYFTGYRIPFSLKNVPLSSGLHGFWWEACCHSHCFAPKGNVSFPSCCFRDFLPFALVFSVTDYSVPCYGFLWVYLLGVHLAFWIWFMLFCQI